MRTPSRRALLCLLLWALAPLIAAQQDQVTNKMDLTMVRCAEASQVFRTPTLVSPDGESRAYVQVEARRIGPPESFPDCANWSRLYVATRKSKGFQLRSMEEPSYWLLGNGYGLVDWSPESRYLGVQVRHWQHESDVIFNSALVYDGELDIFLQPDSDQAFSKKFGKKCWLDVKVLGFSDDSRLIIEAEDDGMSGSSCIQEKNLWLLHLREPSVDPLPSNYKLKRYGKTLPNSSKK